MSSPRDQIERLLELADHSTTPDRIRRHLPSLRAEATRSALRAKENFEQLAQSALPGLPTFTPKAPLYRVQTLATFLRHCARAEYRDLDTETVRRLLEGSIDPDSQLNEMLDREGIAFPWRHSWLVQAPATIKRHTGRELISYLELGAQEPPVVLFVLSLTRLLNTGVEIRSPTAADAALGGHGYWSGTDPPAGPEFVDLDVPAEAIEEVLWRP